MEGRTHGHKILFVSALVVAFVFGFSMGSLKTPVSPTNNSAIQSYDQTKVNSQVTETQPIKTTPQTEEPQTPSAPKTTKATPPKKSSTKVSIDTACPVKGTVSSRIYHMPGGAFYNRLKTTKCFQNEAEAKEAGYVKSGR